MWRRLLLTFDEQVPKTAVDEMVDRIKEALPETPLHYTLEPGEHVFDMMSELDTPWVKDGLAFLNKYWP